MTRMLTCCAIAIAALGAAPRTWAVPVSFEATDNATVRPAGPRSGGSGKNFFNVEGNNNGVNASFGVADFNFTTLELTGTVTAVSGVTIEFGQANAAFSVTGPISVYYTAATDVSIQPDNTGLQYVAGSDGLASVDTDLGTLTLLGSGTYTGMAGGPNGVIDTVALTLDATVQAALVTALNGDATFRLVVTPDEATTAATYAGFGYTSATLPVAGPTLKFEATVSGGGGGDADFDADGDIDGADYLTWQNNLGLASGATLAQGDADGNGAVNAADLVIWQGQFGTAVPVASALPEPGGLTLSLVGLAWAARLKSRRRSHSRLSRLI